MHRRGRAVDPVPEELLKRLAPEEGSSAASASTSSRPTACARARMNVSSSRFWKWWYHETATSRGSRPTRT